MIMRVQLQQTESLATTPLARSVSFTISRTVSNSGAFVCNLTDENVKCSLA